MKFLLDMGLAQSTASYLRNLGFDAVHLRDKGPQRSSPGWAITVRNRTPGTVISIELDGTAPLSDARHRPVPVVEQTQNGDMAEFAITNRTTGTRSAENHARN